MHQGRELVEKKKFHNLHSAPVANIGKWSGTISVLNRRYIDTVEPQERAGICVSFVWASLHKLSLAQSQGQPHKDTPSCTRS